MGNGESSPQPERTSSPIPHSPSIPVPSPLLDQPTRKIIWSAETRDELFKQIQDFKPEGEDVKAAKILMLGHVGSGKSSFVNSINSVLAGRLCQTAIAGSAGKSFTLQFRFWNIKPVQGKSIPVQLCDTMGLEDADNGISEEDLISTIMGHVQNNYMYNQTCPIQKKDPSYKKDPLLGDQVHCVVYVINCRQLSLLTEQLLMKYRNVRAHISTKSIPQVAILTHCDEACEEVEKDLKNVFRSKYINKMMNEASQKLGIPLNCVFPVVNYSTQVETTTDMDVLMLSPFKHMINYAGDFISEKINSETKTSRCQIS